MSATPSPYRLPAATRVGGVRLQVSNLPRSLEYYRTVLGLQLLSNTGTTARLGALGATEPLIELDEREGARPVTRQGRLGLYHFAVLLPTRGDLARCVGHLRELQVPMGASDHLVSEALYLTDRDGLGIEVYADRPRATWRRNGNDLAMDSLPLDFDALLETAGTGRWTGMPTGTVIGHLHLHVGDLQSAETFYGDALGFDVTVRGYPGALFLSAGGYHHHLGTNTWAGVQAPRPTERDARLLEWQLILPDAHTVDAAAASMEGSGNVVRRTGGGWLVTDPWGTSLRVGIGPG